MSDSRGGRWNRSGGGSGKRSSSRNRRGHGSSQQERGRDDYVPPNLGSAMSPSSPTGTSSSGGEYFVTSPPKKSGLTGSISTLFRRAASREPGKRDHRKSRDGNDRGVDSSASHQSMGSPDSLLASSAPSSPNEERAKGGAGLSTSGSGGSFGVIDSPATSRAKSNAQAPSSSVGAGGGRSVASESQSKMSSRIFYSSNQDDDDSDDSYESRERSRASGKGDSHSGFQDDDTDELKTILRYRGFSTSIQNLFLDEALVCASMGCFGLILSNRTEYLLQMRNDRRGVRWGRSTSRRTLPSRIVAYALLLTFVLIASTFVIWGFGNKGTNASFSDGFYDGYSFYDDDAHRNKNYNDDRVPQYDDYGGRNYGGNDDNANQDRNGDDGQVYYNDDAVAVDDDDGNNGNNYNDDAAKNYNNGDDGYYNNYDGNDDGNNNNDDGNKNNNYYNDAWNDGYYSYNDDGRRMTESQFVDKDFCPHRTNGIFKIRDMNEALWIPAIDFIKDEWNQVNDDGRRYRVLEGGSSYSENRDVASDLRIAFVFAFLVVLGILGRRRRMRTRYYLVRARAQEDHLYYASSQIGVKRVAFQDTREDQYEGACSHTLCGCYPTDPPKEAGEVDAEVEVSDEGVVQRKKKRFHEDCVSRAFSCLMACCCGLMCKCWFQCLSICALAQEAREVRLLLPTRYQRLDYITHQPFHEYQKDVNDLRRGWLGKTRKKSGFMPHINALSRLSRYIVAFFIIAVLIITSTLLFNPRANFSWPDAVVLMAAFGQSFLVIYLVHWIFHKSDLSLDAVIKFFAAGFLIAVPSAFVFEGLLVNITLSCAWLVYSIGEWLKGEDFDIWVVGNYRILWILGELVNAYLVAAITEELCKYYTFRCVEHPDLIFITGLDRRTQDDRNVKGGLVKYPFGSHQVENSNRQGDNDSVSGYSQSSRRSRDSRHRGTGREDFDLDPALTEDEFYEDENDVRTHRQRAAAVTTAMISVAVGLACAENFLYVFLIGSSSDEGKSGIPEEWVVLLFRSIFPVHALAAAMQSINMVRKFVECSDDNTHRVGVGRIILPAVLMHGTFDAVLLGINVYIETAWDNFLEANEGNHDENSRPYNPVLVNTVAWICLLGVMLTGVLWYYRENRNQRHRLVLLEEREKANQDPDSELPYTSPSELSGHQTGSEVELV